MSTLEGATNNVASHRPFGAAVFGVFTPFFNPYIVRFAGTRWAPMFALIEHRGRKSGRQL